MKIETELLKDLCEKVELYIQNKKTDYHACIGMGHRANRFDKLIASITSQITPEEEEKVRKEMVEQPDTASAEEILEKHIARSDPKKEVITCYQVVHKCSAIEAMEEYASMKLKAQEGHRLSDDIEQYIDKVQFQVQFTDYEDGVWTVPVLLTKERYSKIKDDYSIKKIALIFSNTR